ncbi:hypothetical protein ACH5RR_032604 [Cinchona calisaya]|uniref:Uncharacterized protein n=1 Tax=Cinchona calisaya TaxID=153742 RepID=A0ABD2YIJ4_9GENT
MLPTDGNRIEQGKMQLYLFYCIFKGIPLDFGYLFCSMWELFLTDTSRNIPFEKILTKVLDFLKVPFSGNKQFPPYFNKSYIKRKGFRYFNDQWLTKAAFDIERSKSQASTSGLARPPSPPPQIPLPVHDPRASSSEPSLSQICGLLNSLSTQVSSFQRRTDRKLKRLETR